MDLATRPDDATLIDIWQEALASVVDLCADIDDDDWSAATPCPGWSVADVVAHLIDIEEMLVGSPRPEHEPAYDALPHASGDLARLTEIGVDYRRSRPRAEVLDELRAIIVLRRGQLDAVEPGQPVRSPFGNETTMERLMRIRIFDSWIHEQDIREAIGREGGWGSRPAVITFQQIDHALPIIWSRNAGAPPGSTVRIDVTGPGILSVLGAVVGEDGRGTSWTPAGDATVDLTIGWPDLVRLAAGRVPTDDPALTGRIRLDGDPERARALLPALTITP